MMSSLGDSYRLAATSDLYVVANAETRLRREIFAVGGGPVSVMCRFASEHFTGPDTRRWRRNERQRYDVNASAADTLLCTVVRWKTGHYVAFTLSVPGRCRPYIATRVYLQLRAVLGSLCPILKSFGQIPKLASALLHCDKSCM